MPKTLVVGSNGNMGRRYCAILKYLNADFLGVDLADPNPLEDYDKIIIATPTETHLLLLKLYRSLFPKADILCEKPFTKNIEKLKDIENIFMVNNYEHMLKNPNQGIDTEYNYYNSGKDGLFWDCIQLFYLAKGPVTLKTDSPLWKVKINGETLDARYINESYVSMVKDFISEMNTVCNFENAVRAHERVQRELQCLK